MLISTNIFNYQLLLNYRDPMFPQEQALGDSGVERMAFKKAEKNYILLFTHRTNSVSPLGLYHSLFT